MLHSMVCGSGPSYWLQMLRDIIFSLLFSFISGNKRVISSITSQRKEGRESRESEQRFTFYNAIQPARSLLGNKWNNWNSIHYTVYVSIQYVLSVREWQARMSMNTKTNKLQHVQSLHLPLSKLNIQTSDNSLFPNIKYNYFLTLYGRYVPGLLTILSFLYIAPLLHIM